MLEAVPRVERVDWLPPLGEGQRGRGDGGGQERTLNLDQPLLDHGRNNRHAGHVGRGEGVAEGF